MTCHCRYQYAPYDGLGLAQAFGFGDMHGGMGEAQYMNALMNSNAKPARKDLTPNQIEWCRANIPSFMPKVPA